MNPDLTEPVRRRDFAQGLSLGSVALAAAEVHSRRGRRITHVARRSPLRSQGRRKVGRHKRFSRPSMPPVRRAARCGCPRHLSERRDPPPPRSGPGGRPRRGATGGQEGRSSRLIDDKASCLVDITGAIGATIDGLSLEGGQLGKQIHGVF